MSIYNNSPEDKAREKQLDEHLESQSDEVFEFVDISFDAKKIFPYLDTAATCLQLLVNACGLEFEEKDDTDSQQLAVEIIANTIYHSFKWYDVDDCLPESNEDLVKRILDLERTVEVLVFYDHGTIMNNSRVKMAVGKKEWDWLMNVADEKPVYWARLNKPEGY